MLIFVLIFCAISVILGGMILGSSITETDDSNFTTGEKVLTCVIALYTILAIIAVIFTAIKL